MTAKDRQLITPADRVQTSTTVIRSRLANGEQPRRANAVYALFIFLNLLEPDAQGLRGLLGLYRARAGARATQRRCGH
jgi:hypothetical protein